MYKVEFENFKFDNFSISASNLEDLIKKYEKFYKKFEYGRIYIHLNKAVDKSVIFGLAPIFEIISENNLVDNFDGKYLLNYRKNGFLFKELDTSYIVSLGDNNEFEFIKSLIVFYYTLIYEKDIYKKLLNMFKYMREDISLGGFNSAVYNGLEGYYYSGYFVKWAYDLRNLIRERLPEDIKELSAVFYFIDNLENPYIHNLNLQKNKNIF